MVNIDFVFLIQVFFNLLSFVVTPFTEVIATPYSNFVREILGGVLDFIA